MFNMNISCNGCRAVVIVVAMVVIDIVEYFTTAQIGHRTRFGLLVHHVFVHDEISPQIDWLSA